MQRVSPRASCDASQSDGCKASGAADIEPEQFIFDAKKYCINIQYYSHQVLARLILLNTGLPCSEEWKVITE
jgi:hypothetical protein